MASPWIRKTLQDDVSIEIWELNKSGISKSYTMWTRVNQDTNVTLLANLNLHNFLQRSSEAFSLRTLLTVLRSLNQLTTENLLLKHFPFAKSRTRDLQLFCPLECKPEQSGDLSRDQDVAEVKEATAALESEADRIQVSFQKSLSQLRDLASDDLFLRLSGKCTVL